jgi:hypothetical protein
MILQIERRFQPAEKQKAPCARDYSTEVFLGFGAQGFPPSRHGALDGPGDLEAGGERRIFRLCRKIK